MPNAKGPFLAKLGHDGEVNLAFLNVEDCVSRVSLREDCLLLGKGEDLLPVADNRKEFPWVEVALFGRIGVSRAVRHFIPCDPNHLLGVYDYSTLMCGSVQMIKAETQSPP